MDSSRDNKSNDTKTFGSSNNGEQKFQLKVEDKLAIGHMRYGLGFGASLRYVNELRATEQAGRLPFLKSSNLHQDVLRGNLGPGAGFRKMLDENEETGPSRLAYL